MTGYFVQPRHDSVTFERALDPRTRPLIQHFNNTRGIYTILKYDKCLPVQDQVVCVISEKKQNCDGGSKHSLCKRYDELFTQYMEEFRQVAFQLKDPCDSLFIEESVNEEVSKHLVEILNTKYPM